MGRGYLKVLNLPYIQKWKCSIDSDGAAALVLVSGEKAVKLGLQVIGKITGYADAAQVLPSFCKK